ncbi:hypothetical protein GCM10022214_43610 [Actinomadura miaoliensis]|uniref:Uncharacterized protein n=1 Tax=Actinomadura miaoliensis TaxID=430685 RepID=A0ABP7W3Q8_9ACTN
MIESLGIAGAPNQAADLALTCAFVASYGPAAAIRCTVAAPEPAGDTAAPGAPGRTHRAHRADGVVIRG